MLCKMMKFFSGGKGLCGKLQASNAGAKEGSEVSMFMHFRSSPATMRAVAKVTPLHNAHSNLAAFKTNRSSRPQSRNQQQDATTAS